MIIALTFFMVRQAVGKDGKCKIQDVTSKSQHPRCKLLEARSTSARHMCNKQNGGGMKRHEGSEQLDYSLIISLANFGGVLWF
ncbi:hypothetical protein J2Z66_004361 [Paenibacillus eucommiae]|uniref:Uncharacterized protein n=1 Tax=Paenibacillus eucommiae TaxID=1355755 RepID=A0ABS4IYT5_9BACL|nr:hypothetical protein [Paenibacillus eucommiae]